MIVDDIKLYDFIPLKDFKFRGEETVIHNMKVAIPTELVITETKVYEPEYARVYDSHLHLVDGQIVDYEELRKIKGFQGTYHYERILLIEVWIDWGSDGHVECSHQGFRYINSTQFKNEMDNIYYGSLPYCISWSWTAEEYEVDKWKRDKEFKEEWEKRNA